MIAKIMRVLALLTFFLTSIAVAKKPNIIIIFCDDMGYGDLSCFGATDWQTPHLDTLAKEGVKLTDFYVATAICSASRASLLTGCYPPRVGITGVLFPNDPIGLNPDETTIAEICKTQNYATAAFGKWHLGDHSSCLPTTQGFDQYYGYPYSNDMWPRGPLEFRKYPELPVYQNDEIIRTEEDQTNNTKELTERSVKFIAENANTPFFLYLAHPQPHVPLYVSPQHQGSSDKGGIYGDVIQEIDWSTGQILAALEKHKLTKDTLILFTSDNGPWQIYGNHGGHTGELRGAKGTSWEGGLRVPAILRYPAQIKPNQTINTPVMTIDLLPTIAKLIDAPLPKNTIDGKDIFPILTGTTKEPAQKAYYFFNQPNNLEAMRMGKWKLQFPHEYRSATKHPGKDGKHGKYTHHKSGLELYDLSQDSSESNNVAKQHPELIAQMQKLAQTMRTKLGDKLTKTSGTENRPPAKTPKTK